MKYLVKDLHVKYFDGYVFDDSEDKFIIGPLNNEKTRIKDVLTGQIVDAIGYMPLSALKTFARGGNYMSLGCMTGCRANEASPHQRLLALVIDSYLKDELVDTKQLEKIKQIMNNEIIKNNAKRIKKEEKNARLQKMQEEFEITEEERDF